MNGRVVSVLWFLAFGYYHLPVQTPANYELVSTCSPGPT